MAPLNFKPPAPRTPLEVARSYIAHSVPVFPCRESKSEEMDPATGEFVERAEKSPYTSNGLKGASTSDRIINVWFGERHVSAMIGLPTGTPLGAWVLDVDVKTLDDGTVIDGFKWLAEQEAIHGALPTDAAASTPRGGRHYYFAQDERVRNKVGTEEMEGIDWRGTGGYVVGPGSVMADGRAYKWLDTSCFGVPDFPVAPDWLLDFVVAQAPTVEPTQSQPYTPPSGDNTRYVEAAVSAELSELANCRAGRNQALNESAFRLGTLVGAGVLSKSEAESHLMGAAQANGYIAKDGERAARQTISSGLQSGIKSPRHIPEREQETTKPVDVTKLVANGLKKAKGDKAKGEAPVDATPEPASVPTPTTTPRPVRERFEKTWFDNIEEGKPKETFIKGVFGLEEFTTISGLPGSGKSVITTDMACHVAAGKEWHGRRVRQGLVVYVAAERKKLTERRMMAFRKQHGVHDVPLLVIGGRLDFTRDLVDARALIAAIQEAEEETGMKCIWVIVDTLTRVFGAGDQNTSKDMTKFVQSCDEIIAETKAHVTAIHHTAWAGERMKGAIDLDGAVDASYMVKASGQGNAKTYVLNCNGTNDGEEGDVVTFKMDSVVLGVDEDGENTTAPVVVPSEPKKPLTSGGVKGIAAKALASLSRALEADGVEPQGPQYPDDIVVVTEETWRNKYYEDNPGKEDTVRKQFGSGLKKLLDVGAVVMVGQWYWVA